MAELVHAEKSEQSKRVKKPVVAESVRRRPLPAPQPQPAARETAVNIAHTSWPRFLANRRIQARLTVGPVGDKYEQEADAVAKQVVRRLSAGAAANAQPLAQRQEDEEELKMKPLAQRQEEEEELQMKPLPSISLLQRQEDEEELQMKPSVQRQEEEEELQMKSLVQRQEEEEELHMKPLAQRQEEEEIQAKPDPMLGGGELSGDVETAVTSAKSGGQPLAESVRGPMEQAFGADFSGVHVHTGGAADGLNRTLSARAFTTGQDIFFRNGEYSPGSSAGQELLAHELTHVVQQGGATAQNNLQSKRQMKPGDQVVQRAIGYEFQTNWGVIEKISGTGLFGRTKRNKFKKGDTLHHYPGFKMTADDAGTRLGAEIEFVVDPPIPETQPGAVVDGIMTQMENIVGLMIPFQTQQRFMLNQATGSAQDATVEVYPTIKGQAQATNMPSNPQVTGGIRLDKMGELFQDIVAAHGQDNANPRYQALQAAGVENYVRMLHTENQGMLGAANTRAGQYQHPATPFAPGPATSAKFKGLIALAMTYLWTARNGYQGGALPYAKAFTLLLGRTDFAAMWNSLPGWERAIYNGRPHEFSARTLAAAGNLPPGDRLLTRGVMNVPNQPQQGTHHIPITRQDWLIGIAQGVDRLSVAQFPHLEGEFESLGHLGAKTDAVGPGGNQQGVVAEFRKVQQQMPYLGWRPFANAIFTYLRTVNQ